MMKQKSIVWIVALVALCMCNVAKAFTPTASSLHHGSLSSLFASPIVNNAVVSSKRRIPRNSNKPSSSSSSSLLMSTDNDGESMMAMSESDQVLLGALGTFASLVTFYSEFTLKTTGCGLPAGPFGLVGLVEGLSYLGVTGVFAYSVVTKVKTGSGLPAGPGGLLGLAEGLSFLAIGAGLVVLILQITNFGYIPNAIPMEGGMCS